MIYAQVEVAFLVSESAFSFRKLLSRGGKKKKNQTHLNQMFA